MTMFNKFISRKTFFFYQFSTFLTKNALKVNLNTFFLTKPKLTLVSISLVQQLILYGKRHEPSPPLTIGHSLFKSSSITYSLSLSLVSLILLAVQSILLTKNTSCSISQIMVLLKKYNKALNSKSQRIIMHSFERDLNSLSCQQSLCAKRMLLCENLISMLSSSELCLLSYLSASSSCGKYNETASGEYTCRERTAWFLNSVSGKLFINK